MIQIPPYIGTRKVARLLEWWFLWSEVGSNIATCPSKYHLSVTFACVRASLSQPTSSQWSDIMAPHNNPVAGTEMKQVFVFLYRHSSVSECSRYFKSLQLGDQPFGNVCMYLKQRLLDQDYKSIIQC